tara:strand:+ start:241 stop:1026 length:786 start_codon:yes stop_codon:yes gene_type:complete
MWTYVRIRSEYWEHDSSRYRLALTQQTLIESLKNQTDKNFSLVLTVSQLDPYYTRRLMSFDSVGVPWYFQHEMDLEVPRRQIEIPDDHYLSPGLIRYLSSVANDKNIVYDMKTGFLLEDGVLREWTTDLNEVRATQITDGDRETQEFPFTWIRISNQMNAAMEGTSGVEAEVRWSGMNQNFISRIAKTKVVTGSALGCQLHPERSPSFLDGEKNFRNRGKVHRGGEIMTSAKEAALADVGSGRSRGNRLRSRRRKAKKNAS